MAIFSQDHFHLYPVGTSFTGAEGKFHMTFQGQQHKVDPAVKAQRTLTGRLLINRLLVDDQQVVYRDSTFTVTATNEELALLQALNGVECYYIPMRHEEGDSHGLDTGYPVLPVITNKVGLNAAEDYWMVGLQLTENSL